MVSPGSSPESLGSSSPSFLRSTPVWDIDGDRQRTWTPDTTPSCVPQLQREAHESQPPSGKTRFQQDIGHGDIWRAHIEKRRLAQISQLGLNQSPSKFAAENASGDQTEPRMRPHPSLWAVAASRWPSATESNDSLSPANKAIPQGLCPGITEPRAQSASAGNLDLPPVHNLREPFYAANWTPSPLIPLSSFSTPLPQKFPGQEPQLSSPPWTISADNTSKTPSALGDLAACMDDRFGKLEFLNALMDPEQSSNLSLSPPQAHSSADMSGKILSQVPMHSQQRTQPVNPQAPTFPTVATTQVPRSPWSGKPSPQQGQATTSFSTDFPLDGQLLTAATALHPSTGRRHIPAPDSFGLPPTPEANQHSTSISTAAATVNAATDNASFYHPMNCRASHHELAHHEAHALLLKGFSPNYRGDPDLPRNQSAAIPAEANCSLFLVGLSPDLTTHELFSGIRNVGRVYATHINPPMPERGHVFSAAKLVFFERQGAELFHALYATAGFSTPLHPHLRARVTWNRVRSAEIDKGGRRSRVLLVSGPPAIVDRKVLCAYLDTKMVYQLDEVVHRGVNDDGSRVLLEFRFGSFRCQAEAARMALMREFREEGVVCEYGWDPCDRAQGSI